MAEQKIPYPPSPTDVPEDLTEYAESYRKQENRLLAGLFVFLIFYIGAVMLFGMGLVNCVNLSEFKAVLAHEFGHFSQSAMASSYTYVASRIIGDLVDGEDWFDRLVNWCKKQDNAVSIFGHAIGACLWVGRK